MASLKKSGQKSNAGKTVEPIDYTLIDLSTGACKKAAENRKNQA